MEHKPEKPNNYLVLAIISTLCCCMPLGIASIIYSTKVDSAYYRGDYALAEASSKSAKNWGIASIITIAAFFIITIIVTIFLSVIGAIDA